MRNIILCILLLAAGLVNAQVWTENYHKGDPMLNDGVSYTSYSYTDVNGNAFVYWDKYPNRYRLTSEKIFNTSADESLFVKVGIYDSNEKLLEMFDMYLSRRGDKSYHRVETYVGGPLTIPVGQNRKVEKILNHLKYGEGSVRFVTSIYNGPDFDLRVPCYKSYKKPNESEIEKGEIEKVVENVTSSQEVSLLESYGADNPIYQSYLSVITEYPNIQEKAERLLQLAIKAPKLYEILGNVQNYESTTEKAQFFVVVYNSLEKMLSNQ